MTGIGAGHFAMKFINLRRPGSKPVFVVLPSENKKYTFYINNVKVVNQSINQSIDQLYTIQQDMQGKKPMNLTMQVNLKKGTITVPPGEPEAVQHIR